MTIRCVFLALTILTANGLLGGCASPHAVALNEAGSPDYRKVDIVYELASERSFQEPTVVAKVNATTNASNTNPSNKGTPAADRDWARTSLRIRYPHPAGHTDMAQVTVRLSKTPLPLDPVEPTRKDRAINRRRALATGQNPASLLTTASHTVSTSSDDEIHTLDIPRHQLDLLLLDLARSGFFSDQQRPSGRVRLYVRVDGGHNLGTWDPEPRLDDIASRVLHDGRLQGFAPASKPSDRHDGWSF
jgi:hypothetical protein